MTRTVSIVELSVYDNTIPLVAGYLQCYATQDPVVAESFTFDIYSRSLRTDPGIIAADLLARDSDVYAFSCYIWNMGVVRTVLAELRARRPDAQFLLGGPQVINHAEEYVRPDHRNVVVCNGEGERPFQEYLRQLAGPAPDFTQVSGVSFWAADGELVTTPGSPRLASLDDVPSPFQAGIFDGGEYTFTVLETNRGCPFHCGFCFWGAATNSKVNKFETQRIMDDISWLARNGVASIFIADANWGLSPRDVDLSRHIVAQKREHGFPTSMVIAAAKNRPQRVAEITEILVRGGLVTSQPISLQTVNSDALRLIDRENIRETTYTELQQTLNDKGISSFIELIWPLPGETLESFRAGVGRLCRMNADTLTIYPQLLLHNTEIYRRRDVLGIEVSRVPDACAEADVVVATKWVSRQECIQGAWFHYAVHSLYNARAGHHLAAYLDRSGTVAYEDFLATAADHLQRRDDEMCRFFASSIDAADNYDLLNVGKAAFMVLHSHRAAMDELLRDFCATQPWWSDPAARLALDLDLVARPYLYSEDVQAPAVALAEATITGLDATSVTLSAPPGSLRRLAELGVLPEGEGDLVRFVHPRTGKMPYPRRHSMEHNAAYCHVMIQRLRTLLPSCTRVAGVALAG
jgi:hypothetical protein